MNEVLIQLLVLLVLVVEGIVDEDVVGIFVVVDVLGVAVLVDELVVVGEFVDVLVVPGKKY